MKNKLSLLKIIINLLFFAVFLFVVGCAVVLGALFFGGSLFLPPRACRPRSCHAPRPAQARGGCSSVVHGVFPFRSVRQSPASAGEQRAPSLISSSGARCYLFPLFVAPLLLSAPACAVALIPRADARGGVFCVLNLSTGLVAQCECYISAVNLCLLIGGAVFNMHCQFGRDMLEKCRELWRL